MAEELSDKDILSLLRSTDPYDCERIIGELWRSIGYSVEIKNGSQDKAIDIVGKKSDPFERTQLIQVKRYSEENKIGSQQIRNYRTLYEQESDVDRVVLVTTGYFTSQASDLASDLDVETLNGVELVNLIRNQAPDILKEICEEEKESEVESPSTEEGQPEASMPEDEEIGVLERQRLKTKLRELREKRGGADELEEKGKNIAKN